MKQIKDYVCTLEQAKRLKELNVEQDSLYWYSKININVKEFTLSINKEFYEGINYSAFISQELGELIFAHLKLFPYKLKPSNWTLKRIDFLKEKVISEFGFKLEILWKNEFNEYYLEMFHSEYLQEA
jgi:hypothetical protein